MWKFIVTWIMTSTSTAPCPDVSFSDDFGTIGNTSTVCSALHLETTNRHHKKIFIDRDSAFTFYEKGKKRIKENENLVLIPSGRISSIKIDSAYQIHGLKIKED